ncbi:MAG: hypothetical protein MUD08_03835 [Cytophagales bacterium]|jgi:hypothetical protein|nr:hypothetical protein [Cytophagales bacterium]
MKKLFLSFLTVAVVTLTSQSVQAQYEKGDLLINPGVSLLGYGYGFGFYGSYTGLPGLTANVEYNVTDNIAVGPYAGFLSRSYRYDIGGTRYTDRWTNIAFGVRGVFHASEVINDALGANINSEKLDIYGGLSLGYETWRWSYDDSFSGGLGRNDYGTGRIVLGGVLGGRYMFSQNFGAYAELGRGALGALTLGVTLKL